MSLAAVLCHTQSSESRPRTHGGAACSAGHDISKWRRLLATKKPFLRRVSGFVYQQLCSLQPGEYFFGLAPNVLARGFVQRGGCRWRSGLRKQLEPATKA